jgi:hypothetical protein
MKVNEAPARANGGVMELDVSMASERSRELRRRAHRKEQARKAKQHAAAPPAKK